MPETAITKKEGPCIILAGAGTGKTYTIIEKLTYLIKHNIYAPERILCLTFSNEAVATLRARIRKTLPDSSEPIIRTFHSFCAELLKSEGAAIGIKPDFRILVPDEAKIMLHKNLKINPNLCSKYIETLSVAKDLGITPVQITDHLEKKKRSEYADDLQQSIESMQFELNTRHAQQKRFVRHEMDDKRDRLKRITALLKLQKFMRAWNAYEKLKEKRGFLDYADLHTKALELLKKEPALAKNYEYAIVDEFQDTNKMQFELLTLLLPHKNVTVVGDLNQSIYRFRGAYKENITAFKDIFGAKQEDMFALEKSFRSPNSLLRIANKLLKKENSPLILRNAHEREGEKAIVYEMRNDKEEMRKVMDIIEQEQKNVPLEEICVMFRTHQQSQRLKRLLEEKHIPYVAVTKTSLLDIPHIQRILNYLAICHALAHEKPGGEHAWWELIHSYAFSKEDLSLLGKGLKKYEESPCLSREFMNYKEKELTESATTQLAAIKQKLETLKNLLLEKKPLLECIDYLNQEEKETISEEMNANYVKFKNWVEEYTKTESPDLGDFLYHVTVMKKLGIVLESARMEQHGIRIMTHHATKGLEYEVVIITNMAQNRFPSDRTRSSDLLPPELMPDSAEQLKDVPPYMHEELIASFERSMLIAEERRLCYVACTRAKQRLYMTFAREYGHRTYTASQFLDEIEYTTNPDITLVQDLTETPQTAPELVPASEIPPQRVRKKTTFSPSALLLFNECQKRYEYKYLYHMPEKEPSSWEEMQLGSFVHKIMEEGVRNKFRTEQEFIDHAREKYREPEWNQINLEDALPLLRVFYQRNKNKYTPQSLTEIKLRAELDGIIFEGYADRIDVNPQGLEIVDYKTGKTYLTAQHRNWQLGIYALAAPHLGLGPVKKLTLDMLRHEKPHEFELLADGTARDVYAPRTTFNLHDVEKELVTTARKIQSCYEKGFQPCDIEDNCEFCNEIIWKIQAT